MQKFNSITKIFLLLITLFFLTLKPFSLNAAEVLQITNSSTLLIGDQNRNYTVKIACLDLDPSKESYIIDYLKSELPRRSRVNLKPKGSQDGVLIAKIISIENNIDVGDMIVAKEWAKPSC